eukprot:scaffold664_cov232-Prasinococcus_capsulatus_cf.AAC.4
MSVSTCCAPRRSSSRLLMSSKFPSCGCHLRAALAAAAGGGGDGGGGGGDDDDDSAPAPVAAEYCGAGRAAGCCSCCACCRGERCCARSPLPGAAGASEMPSRPQLRRLTKSCTRPTPSPPPAATAAAAWLSLLPTAPLLLPPRCRRRTLPLRRSSCCCSRRAREMAAPPLVRPSISRLRSAVLSLLMRTLGGRTPGRGCSPPLPSEADEGSTSMLMRTAPAGRPGRGRGACAVAAARGRARAGTAPRRKAPWLLVGSTIVAPPARRGCSNKATVAAAAAEEEESRSFAPRAPPPDGPWLGPPPAYISMRGRERRRAHRYIYASSAGLVPRAPPGRHAGRGGGGSSSWVARRRVERSAVVGG